MSKDYTEVRDKLVDFAERIGYTVELDSKMEDHVAEAKDDPEYAHCFDEAGTMVEECRPAGSCHYLTKKIKVREGKGVKGQVTTLIHEIVHAIMGLSFYAGLGEQYNELVCESVAQYVTQVIGIDRTLKTANRIIGYGFKGYFVSPVTKALVNVFCYELGEDQVEILPIVFELQPKG